MLLRSWKIWSILLTVILCLGGFGYVQKSYAASTFSVSDKQTGCTSPKWDATITGSSMVFMGEDEGRWNQIFSCNLETGELKQLTTEKTYKERLSAGGDYAVYLESQFNIILLNLQTGEKSKPDIKPAHYDKLRTDGNYVTYLNNSTLNVYEIGTSEVKQIGEGMGPSIVEGKVVYSKFSDSGLDIMLYDARAGTSRVLQKAATQGYGDVAFNGKNVVWTLRVKMDYQNRILHIDDIDPLPEVLNLFQEQPTSFHQMKIGTNFAAWPARNKGKETIVASDLASRQTDIAADNGEELIGIYHNQLVLKDKEDKVFLRSLTLTGQGKPLAETLVSAVPIPSNKIPDQAYGQLGGRHPISLKQIALSDKSVILSTEEMTGDGNFSTITHQQDDLTLTKALEPGQKMVSQPWQISIGTHLHGPSVKLSMTYLTQRVPAGQQDKLGIYRLDSGKWIYMGGLFEQNNERVNTDIIKSGVYMVLYYDVPNPYIRDYWREKRIKELNTTKPIRVFLDGEELSFHEQPVLKDGSTTVEFRPIFEKLGLQIEWDGTTQTISGTKQGTSLQLAVGQSNAVVNGSTSELPTSPFLNHDYTFVPLRFVGEATGRKVLWDFNLNTVYLYDPATEGKLYNSSGALLYEGQLKNGKMNGKGKLYHEDGTLWYDAEFQDNEVMGWGTLYFSGYSRGRERTGEVSIGQFKDGLPEGYVININDNSFVQYEGQVIRGIFNGKGKYYEMDQLIYDGEFKDNLFDGYGKYYSDGKLDYEGYFVKNVPHGHGKKYRSNGTIYSEGEYVNGMLQGK